ncbi:MAG: ABC transporter permease subunit [Lachnospiraceae bacterium]|nr:ABC transporter permease subunit [Lachnospiraceae bacterium]
MLNLIKNEYAKIFHKTSTYVLIFVMILFTVMIPIGSIIIEKIESKVDFGFSYTIDSAISDAKEMEDDTELHFLETVKNLDLDYEKYYNGEKCWQVNELYNITYDYWTYANSKELIKDDNISKEDQKTYNEKYENCLEAIKNNDWKKYYGLRLDYLKEDSDFAESSYIAAKYVYDYRISHDLSPDSDDGINDILTQFEDTYCQYLDTKEQFSSGMITQNAFENFESTYETQKYCLEHNISNTITDDPNAMDDLLSNGYVITSKLYNYLDNINLVLSIVLILTLIVAGNIFAKEFSQGTIKFLLINPVKRSKIFWSKYITVITYATILTFGIFILGFLASGIVTGFDGINTHYITYTDGAVKTIPAILFIGRMYLFTLIKILVVATIAFMISSFARSTALAIALSLVFFYIGNIVCSLAIIFNLDFMRYTIFACMDLKSVVYETIMLEGITLKFALAVLFVHVVLLLLTAYDSFTKKNI